MAGEAFPNLASFNVPVFRDAGGHCFVNPEDLETELSRRNLWERFSDAYQAERRKFLAGSYVAWDAEKTLFEILTAR